MPLPPVFDRSTIAPRQPSLRIPAGATPPISPVGASRSPARTGFFEPGTSRILRAVGAGLNPQLLPLQQQVLQQEQERIRQQQEQEQKGRDRNLKFLMDARGKVQDPTVLREIDAKIQELGGPDVSMIPPIGLKVPFGRTPEGGVKPEFLAGEEALAGVKRAPTKPGALVTLSTDRGPVTLRQSDPRVDQLISQGATKVRVSGTPKEIGLGGDKTAVRKSREQISASAEVIINGQRIIDLARQAGNQGLGVSGFLNTLSDTLVSQSNAIAKSAGIDLGKTEVPDNVKRIAGLNTRLQNRFKAVAVLIATSEQGARPSDLDVRQAMDRIGKNAGNLRQLTAAIEEEMRSVSSRAQGIGTDINFFNERFTFEDFARSRGAKQQTEGDLTPEEETERQRLRMKLGQ